MFDFVCACSLFRSGSARGGKNRHRIGKYVLAALAGFWFLPAGAAVPYHQTVTASIQPITEQLLLHLVKDGREMKLDGVAVFNGDDKFLPGKIALGVSDFLTSLPPGDPRLPEYLADFGKIAKLTVNDTNHTWGIYYYLSALNLLRQAGKLDQAVDPETLAKLKTQLDWRHFVKTSDFTLIDLPNNYYCVALAIARLRVAMGWEDSSGAETLLAKTLEHYRRYSGPYGFADETNGDGRFDRYSVLLSAEITQRFLETGAKPPPEVLGWLRKSADVILLRLNAKGEGFEYGRRLGPYAYTAMVEVLTAAAVAGVLTPREKELAYAFVCRAAERYVSFWVNKDTASVDLWGQGRRTDAYRGKFRILGENLSLTHQFVYTDADWNALGYTDKAPMADFDAALATLPERSITWFSHGDYDRMLLTIRDHGRLIGLPLVNGAQGQHMHSPYFPIPFSPGMLSGVADGSAPLLVPRFSLADGAVLEPLAYFQDGKVTTAGDTTTLTYRQSRMDRLGSSDPVPDDRLGVRVTYVLSPGRITRTEVYTPKAALAIAKVGIEFATHSGAFTQNGGVTRFGQGAVRSFTAEGYESCQTAAVNGDQNYQTPAGPFQSRVRCSRGPLELTAPMTFSWTLTYQ